MWHGKKTTPYHIRCVPGTQRNSRRNRNVTAYGMAAKLLPNPVISPAAQSRAYYHVSLGSTPIYSLPVPQTSIRKLLISSEKYSSIRKLHISSEKYSRTSYGNERKVRPSVHFQSSLDLYNLLDVVIFVSCLPSHMNNLHGRRVIVAFIIVIAFIFPHPV